MWKSRLLITALLPLAMSATAQTTSSGGGRSVANPVDVPANDRAQAAATNAAALKSPRPNTLKPSDLVSATNDAGGRTHAPPPRKSGTKKRAAQPH